MKAKVKTPIIWKDWNGLILKEWPVGTEIEISFVNNQNKTAGTSMGTIYLAEIELL